MTLALAILAIILGPLVTLVVGLALHNSQREIKVSVDGRLEKAYEKVDRLELTVAALTGATAPPPVAGQTTLVSSSPPPVLPPT
jgi:hypothetical protein